MNSRGPVFFQDQRGMSTLSIVQRSIQTVAPGLCRPFAQRTRPLSRRCNGHLRLSPSEPHLIDDLWNALNRSLVMMERRIRICGLCGIGLGFTAHVWLNGEEPSSGRENYSSGIDPKEVCSKGQGPTDISPLGPHAKLGLVDQGASRLAAEVGWRFSNELYRQLPDNGAGGGSAWDCSCGCVAFTFGCCPERLAKTAALSDATSSARLTGAALVAAAYKVGFIRSPARPRPSSIELVAFRFHRREEPALAILRSPAYAVRKEHDIGAVGQLGHDRRPGGTIVSAPSRDLVTAHARHLAPGTIAITLVQTLVVP